MLAYIYICMYMQSRIVDKLPTEQSFVIFILIHGPSHCFYSTFDPPIQVTYTAISLIMKNYYYYIEWIQIYCLSCIETILLLFSCSIVNSSRCRDIPQKRFTEKITKCLVGRGGVIVNATKGVSSVCEPLPPDRPLWFPGSTPPSWLDGRHSLFLIPFVTDDCVIRIGIFFFSGYHGNMTSYLCVEQPSGRLWLRSSWIRYEF